MNVAQLKRSSNYGWDWSIQVKPLNEFSGRRFYGENYFDMNAVGDDRLSEKERPEILVCHDYQGNYLDDRFIRNESVNWDAYRFYSWSGIDIFCYFSHNFVTVPTLQFINAAHLNGVKVMGTIIFEHLEGTQNLLDILKDRETVDEVTEALVNLCKKLKFEGWFFNIEVSLDPKYMELLKYFVSHLTGRIHANIPHGRVIWYDSITIEGLLKWQNQLNDKNEDFFIRCDGIFTNYSWSELDLDTMSWFVEKKYPDKRHKVFVGIDIFGRGQLAKFETHKVHILCFIRYCYYFRYFKTNRPIFFILFKTLEKVVQQNFSVAIFAPGWTHENIDISKFFCEPGSDEYRDKRNASFLERNDRLWNSMYPFMFLNGPKTMPFTSNFSIGSGRGFYRMGAKVRGSWFNLKNQGLLPSTPATNDIYKFFYDDAFEGGNSILLQSTNMVRLFACDFDAEGDMIFSYTFKRSDKSNDIQFRWNYTIPSRIAEESYLLTEVFGSTYPNTIKTCSDGGEMKQIAKYFIPRGHSVVPNIINGWETRYYLIQFTRKLKITDIGVKKIGNDQILLGFISLLPANGFNSENCNNINIL